MRRRIPLALTLLRLALAPMLLLLSDRPRPLTFGLILTAAVLSDIFDGVLARRLRVATPFLRRLDSAVDIIFYLAVGWTLWRLRPEVVRAHEVLLGAVVGLELLRFGIERRKYGRKASYHLWSAKAWGLALFAGALGLLGFGGGSGWFALMLWPGIVENLEALAVTFLLPAWTHDVPSAVHAFRMRATVRQAPLAAGGGSGHAQGQELP
ncbi:MAG TPA: CDP-alcohol phosphatidyltransferase family protein [Holophagaceae bacterium]|nr:CDP-alcohol phosphatidyltransferase family protein [Holophagaceae bacterium]